MIFFPNQKKAFCDEVELQGKKLAKREGNDEKYKSFAESFLFSPLLWKAIINRKIHTKYSMNCNTSCLREFKTFPTKNGTVGYCSNERQQENCSKIVGFLMLKEFLKLNTFYGNGQE